MLYTKILLAIWPIAVAVLGYFFYHKQNSKDPWTGGPISWPKSLWLANAVFTWFLYPLFLLLLPNTAPDLQLFLLVHLVGWWTRGVLELVMIYKWYNWSPKYGITHDLCQATFYFVILAWALVKAPVFDAAFWFVFSFGLYMLMQMIFEVSFAYLFFKARSEQEAADNIYFASDDPKWIFINRLTLTAVVLSFAYGAAQAIYVSFWL